MAKTTKSFLNEIRKPEHGALPGRQIINSVLVILLGLALGAAAKHLDFIPSNELPYLVQSLDLRNFFSRLAVWILIAVIISVYSSTPVRAGINTFLFFLGMLTTYYAYTIYIAGFFPGDYMLIWVGLTVLSPFLAFICWYATGEGKVSLLISATITGVLFMQAFSFGMFYFGAISYLEVLVWLVGIAVLYKTPKQLAAMLGASIVIAVSIKFVLP